MSTDARKVMTMSMVKITSSRTRKSGISLRQNLLVANVLLSARNVFLTNAAESRTKRDSLKRRRSKQLEARDVNADLVAKRRVGNDDAVVPDMDDRLLDSADSESKSRPRKRLHDEVDQDSTDTEAEGDNETENHQPAEKRTQKELTALNNLVNRFSGLLEHEVAVEEEQEDEDDEPTTDGFINKCSTRVIDEYDTLSNRPIQMEV